MGEQEPQILKGLAGVTVDTTNISKVMWETNSLTYRGYPVQDLAANCSFEEVAYLLWHGELPNKAQLASLCEAERSQRELPADLIDIMRKFSKSAHPMDTLRTAVSFIAVNRDDTEDNSPEAELRKSIDLLAKIPAIIATDFRLKHGKEPVKPDPALSLSQNFFWQSFGEKPSDAAVKCMEISLILYAEHSFNASTFAARVIASTTSDLHSAVVGAIGALKGPLHGGANEAVMHMLLEIDDPAKAKQWMLDALTNKRKIMGFGHRVYRSGDSRVPTMHNAMVELAKHHKGADKWVEISRILQETMLEQKNIHPNLDFPAGPAYYLMGFDIPMFTPIFVASRITGWTAHIMEQRHDNKLIRPLSHYTGPAQREFVSIEKR